MENEVLKSPSEFDVSSAIKKWRSQGFPKEMIELARNDMAEYGMPFKQVSIYMDVKLSVGQAEQLSQALRNEVNEDFVRHLAEGGYSAEQIKTILRFTSEVPVDVIEKNVTSDMKAHAISKALQAVKDSLAEAKQAVPEENEKVKEVLDSISEQLSALSQNAELIEKVSKKLDEMPKTESVDEESIRKEYEGKLEQKEAELSTQQDQINKLMKTKAELTRKLEQMQEENQSVSKLRESMDQEMDEYRKQKNQILDERDDALRESRNLRKEMGEMKRTIGELEKQIKERNSRELERQLLNQTYQTQSVENVERAVPVNEGVAEEKKTTPGWQAGYQAVVPNRYGGTQIVQIEHIRKKGPEHLLALAGKKCFRSKAKYNLIQQMKEADLSKSQMEQIQVAIESGLTDTEVSDIINSGFDVEEMAQAIQILLADKMYQ